MRASCFSLAAALVLSGCSGSSAPKFGTPEWYWAAAREQFSKGDLAKTQEHLEKIIASDNPYKKRAATWQVVVLAGMAQGYKELSDAYDAGSSQSKTQVRDFQRLTRDLRRLSRQYSMGLAQEVDRLKKEMGDAEQITLEYAFPRGGPAEVGTLDRVRKGVLPMESERANAESMSLARGVLLQTAAAVGAGQDTAKASELFKTQPVPVPRAVFLFALADRLVEQAGLFDRRKLNEPDKKKLLLDMATDCLKPAQSADAALKKKAKALQEKIDKERKSLPKDLAG